jgi:hypothetical protein
VNAASWQSRTAVALGIGAAGEGACVLLGWWLAGVFVLGTIVVALAVGWRFGPAVGGAGAGIPPLGVAFVRSGNDAVGERVSVALFLVLLLGGAAWVTGRVRERYGNPPWGHSTGVSE